MRKIIMVAAGALVLVGVNAGVTAAMTSSAPSPAVVRAYYNNKTHALYFSAKASHPTGTTAISWLKSGTAGPAGINVAGQAATNKAGVSTVTLNCPSSHPYLIGGGGGGLYPEMLVYNGPANMGRGWSVTVKDSRGNYPAESIYVHVFCAK